MSDAKERVHFEALYARVHALLVDGVYRPGDRISVKDIAGLMGASTTPAREILSRLVGRSLVEERRSEGYYLRPLDERQIAGLYDLHALCIDIALLDPAASGSGRLVLDGDDVWALFDLLVDATGNVALLDTRRFLNARLSLLRRCEVMLFDDLAAEADCMFASLTHDDRGAQRKMVRTFHKRRARHARQLAFCLTHR